MTIRQYQGFQPISSTAPGFELSFDNTATNAALESTSIREWRGGGGRMIHIASIRSDSFHVAFGNSDVTVGASNGILILGRTVEKLLVPKPAYTHIACRSSTDVTVNFSLGYGGQ